MILPQNLNFSKYLVNFHQTAILKSKQKKNMKQNISREEISLDPGFNTKAKPNRHVSVLYGMQYLTKVPVVKRCRKTEYECFANINKKEIFSFVHMFVQKLLDSPEYLNEVLEEMKFQDNELQPTIISSRDCGVKINVLQEKQPENSMEEISLERIEDLRFNEKSFNLKVSNKAKSCKKISIMIDGGFDDFDQENGGSVLFSDQSLSGLSSVNISEQEFTLKMVEKIYEQPEPFLINLSVCLMLKFLSFSKTKLTAKNVCWILSIGTIIAYKIYYDEPVQGLAESFAYILKIKRDDIIKLQRHFLSEINHEAVISNQQYHSTLYHIIKQEHSQN